MNEPWPVRVAIRQAFTLIELLVVIAIIAILAAIIVPAVVSVQRQANDAKDLEQVRGLGNGFTLYFKKYSFFPALTNMATAANIGAARSADVVGGEATTSLKLLMAGGFVNDAKVFFSPREPAPDDATLKAMQVDLDPTKDPTWYCSYAYDAGHNPDNGIAPFFGNRKALVGAKSGQLAGSEPCHVLTCELTAKEINCNLTDYTSTEGYAFMNVPPGATKATVDDIYANDSTTGAPPLGFRDSDLADSTNVSAKTGP